MYQLHKFQWQRSIVTVYFFGNKQQSFWRKNVRFGAKYIKSLTGTLKHIQTTDIVTGNGQTKKHCSSETEELLSTCICSKNEYFGGKLELHVEWGRKTKTSYRSINC